MTPSLTIEFIITTSFRIQAMMATFLGFPAAIIR